MNPEYEKNDKEMKTLMNSYNTTASRTFKGKKAPKQQKVDYDQWNVKVQAPGFKNTAYNTTFIDADVGVKRRPSLRPAEPILLQHPFATISSYQDAYEKVDKKANKKQFDTLKHNTKKASVTQRMGSMSNPKYMFYMDSVPFIESDPELLMVADPEVLEVPFVGSSHYKKVHRQPDPQSKPISYKPMNSLCNPQPTLKVKQISHATREHSNFGKPNRCNYQSELEKTNRKNGIYIDKKLSNF